MGKGNWRVFLRRIAFAAYCVLMLWLLFVRNRHPVLENYWAQMEQNVNLVPFHTIRLYLYVFRDSDLSHLIPHAIVNLVGNVVMFIPLGVFLCSEFSNRGKGFKVLLTTIAVICLVELMQLVTLAGSCDVDDLLLNLTGSMLGCIMYCVFSKK
jgi:glycopeptide antibiotics resistance protein